jgi:prepilin-type N-terminal cleavage/methylation domain-containing protein
MDRTRDRGFTLIELLIVIVILGILATVVVFAVGGVTDRGQDASCSSELRVISTAQEAYRASNGGTYVDETTLVADNLLRDESELYDLTVDVNGNYTIAPAVGSACTLSATNANVPPTPPATPTAIMFGAYPAWQYGAAGADEILVLGRAKGVPDWISMITSAPPTSRRVTFINLDEITSPNDVNTILQRSRSNGITDVGIYHADDTVQITGPSTSYADVDAYLVGVVAPDPYHSLSPTGGSIEDLIGSIG